MTDPYRRIARFYDALVEPFNAKLRGYVARIARPEAGMKVLEIGCGTGTNLEIFADAGCEVSGLDLSPSMTDLARQKLGRRADLRLGDASDMPFADNSFDLVLAFLTIHEMPPEVRRPVLDEVVRVMGGDGKALFVDYHPGPKSFPSGWVYRPVIYTIELGAGWEHFQNHRHFLANGGLPPYLDDHGFRVIKERVVAGGNILVALTSRAAGL